MSEPTVEEVVAKYVETRDEIDRRVEELEKELKPLREYQTMREAFLAKKLTEAGAQNIKTPHGTAFFKKQEFVNVADWDTFVENELLTPIARYLWTSGIIQDSDDHLSWDLILEYIKTSFPLELLNHSVNKTEVLSHMGEKRESPPPKGINYVSKQVVQIHRK